jgi:hypothetical protein
MLPTEGPRTGPMSRRIKLRTCCVILRNDMRVKLLRQISSVT